MWKINSVESAECGKINANKKIRRVQNEEYTGERGWLYCFRVSFRKRNIAASLTSHTSELRNGERAVCTHRVIYERARLPRTTEASESHSAIASCDSSFLIT